MKKRYTHVSSLNLASSFSLLYSNFALKLLLIIKLLPQKHVTDIVTEIEIISQNTP